MLLRKLNPTLFIFPVLAAFVLAVSPTSVMAAETRGGNEITVRPDEIVDDDLYAFGQNVTILGRVTGSVIAGGNTVTIAGTVGGDVMAAGSTVLVDGPVHGSIRAAGQSVQVRNRVDGDLLGTGNSVSVLGDGSVGRDLLAGGSALTIAGPVGRNVNASGQEVRISSAVGGDVTTNATNLRLDPMARVNGGISYTSPNEVEVAPGATVGGPIVRSEPANQSEAPVTAAALDWIKGLVGFAVLGLVLLVLFPRAASRNAQMLRRSPWLSLGLGAAILIVTPLLATLVLGIGLWVGGWWFGPLLLGTYLVWLALGYLVSAVALGRELLARVGRPERVPVWGLLLGLLILAALQFIPFVGGLAALAAVLFGSGALLLTLTSTRTPRGWMRSEITRTSIPNRDRGIEVAVP